MSTITEVLAQSTPDPDEPCCRHGHDWCDNRPGSTGTGEVCHGCQQDAMDDQALDALDDGDLTDWLWADGLGSL